MGVSLIRMHGAPRARTVAYHFSELYNDSLFEDEIAVCT